MNKTNILHALALLFLFLYSSWSLANPSDPEQEEQEQNTKNNAVSDISAAISKEEIPDNYTAQITFFKNSSVTGGITNTNFAGINNTHIHNSTRERCDFKKLGNVKNPTTYVQERKKELDDIHRASLENSKNGTFLICITGFSGSGKTQLAAKYAYNHEKDYQHIRFFDASDKDKLLKSFISFARSLCHEDLDICLYRQGDEHRDCVVDIVGRCIKELGGNFLWVFDNAKGYEDIEKYILNEQGINGSILITTQNKESFVSRKAHIIDLNEGMTEEESRLLLSTTIQEIIKTPNIDSVCNSEEIREIAVDIWGKLPLPIAYTGELIGRLGSCKEYIKEHNSNPEGEKSLAKELRYKIQEDAILEQISLLDKLNLDIIGFLSFMETPFPTKLVVAYISANNECRNILSLSNNAYDKIKISSAIDKFNLVKNSKESLSFPHELFREQIQQFLLKRDEKNYGSYKEQFDKATEFLYENFSGCFWDDSKWSNEKDVLLDSVKRIVNVFMVGISESSSDMNPYEHKGLRKVQTLNNHQLTLMHRLAKYYIQKDPVRAIELFNGLLKKIMDNKASKNSLSEYSEGSVNHAAVMRDLVVANCQMLNNTNNAFDTNEIEKLAESAYKIFKKELTENNPRTINAYLTLAHIRLNLRYMASTEESKDNIVRFFGSEPTIDAAIKLLGSCLSPEKLDSLRKELSSPEKSSNNIDYSAIYDILNNKVRC